MAHTWNCIYPARGSLDMVPGPELLEHVIRRLLSSGWTDGDSRFWKGIITDASGRLERRELRVDRLLEDLQSISTATTSFVLDLPRRQPGIRGHFVDRTDPMLTAEFCDGVKMAVSGRVFQLPHEWPECVKARCLHCDRESVSERTEAAGGVDRSIAMCFGGKYLPLEACPGCGAALGPESMYLLVNETREGENDNATRREVAPFLRFGLRVYAPFEMLPDDANEIALDPLLVAELSEVLGTPLRALAEWGYA